MKARPRTCSGNGAVHMSWSSERNSVLVDPARIVCQTQHEGGTGLPLLTLVGVRTPNRSWAPESPSLRAFEPRGYVCVCIYIHTIYYYIHYYTQIMRIWSNWLAR